MATIVVKNLPIDKLFIDGVEELIFVRDEENPEGVRKPHRGKPGYQRDPWKRLKWLSKRSEFNPALYRALDVSKRSDGMYAVVDGGIRHVIGQLNGMTTVACRIHEGLTRAEEAILFADLDSEAYGLRSVDNFLAHLAGGEPIATAIAAAVKPYRVAVSGTGTLKCVTVLTHMLQNYDGDHAAGSAFLATVCKAAAAGWSGYTENGKLTGRQLDPRCVMALGLLVDAAEDKLDTDVLHRVLTKYPPNTLIKKVKENNAPNSVPTQAYAVQMAKLMVQFYDRSFANKPARKIGVRNVDNCQFISELANGKTYAALIREARESAAAEQQEAA